jgi:hypothetical protein
MTDSVVKEGSVINHFTYTEGSGWNWVQVDPGNNSDAIDTFHFTVDEPEIVVVNN